MDYIGTVQQLQTTAFGDLDVASPTPKIQLQFPYNINGLETVRATTGSGTVSFSQPFAVCSTTAATNSTASLSSKKNLHYATGQGGLCLLTAVFTTGASGSTQWAGFANTLDALFFGYSGATFGVNRRYNGTDNFIAQSSWNVDKMDGTGPSGMTLDPTKGNVYKIQYQWLGFGNIKFYIENPATGTFQNVHNIQYPNSATTTSLLNPAMQINIQANNTANNTNISIRCPSMSAFVQGNLIPTGNNFSFANSKTIATTLTSIFGLKNNTTFNGITNYKSIYLTGLSFTNGSIISAVSLILNGTIGGSPVYTNISSTTSVASVDTAGAAVTGGTTIITFYNGTNTSLDYDLTNLNLYLEPGDVLSFCARGVSGGLRTLFGSLRWIEQY